MLKGLLDTLNSEEGQLGLAMLAAAGPQGGPMSFGQRMQMVSMHQQAMKQAKEDRALKQLMTQLQMDELTARKTERQDAMTERQRTRERTNQFFNAIQPQTASAEEVLANGGGLTPENASRVGQPKPLDLQRLALQFPDQLPTIKALAEAQNFGVQAPIKLGAGDVLLDPKTRQPIFTAPNKPAEAPGDVRQYQFAVEQGYKGSFLDFQKELKRAGASTVQVQYGAPVAGQDAKGNPIFFQPSKDGGAPAIIPGVAPPKKDELPNGEERKAATLLTRIEAAQATIDDVTKQNPSQSAPNITQYIPFDGLRNLVNPEARQRVEAAQLDFLDAALTLGTGAAYTKEQLEGYRRSYFPQVGDNDKTVQDKLERQKQLIEAARLSAGRAKSAFSPADKPAETTKKKPMYEGMYGGRRVIKYDDGSISYAD